MVAMLGCLAGCITTRGYLPSRQPFFCCCCWRPPPWALPDRLCQSCLLTPVYPRGHTDHPPSRDQAILLCPLSPGDPLAPKVSSHTGFLVQFQRPTPPSIPPPHTGKTLGGIEHWNGALLPSYLPPSLQQSLTKHLLCTRNQAYYGDPKAWSPSSAQPHGEDHL